MLDSRVASECGPRSARASPLYFTMTREGACFPDARSAAEGLHATRRTSDSFSWCLLLRVLDHRVSACIVQAGRSGHRHDHVECARLARRDRDRPPLRRSVRVNERDVVGSALQRDRTREGRGVLHPGRRSTPPAQGWRGRARYPADEGTSSSGRAPAASPSRWADVWRSAAEPTARAARKANPAMARRSDSRCLTALIAAPESRRGGHEPNLSGGASTRSASPRRPAPGAHQLFTAAAATGLRRAESGQRGAHCIERICDPLRGPAAR